MARRSRLEVNRAALDVVTLGLADGVFDVARAILRVAEATAPDAEPYGEGLVSRGAAITFVGSKRTHQVRTDGSSTTVRKPRGSRRLAGAGVTGIVGFGFPSMFQELGTVNHRAQPFLTPAVAEVAGGEAKVLLSRAMQRRLRGERDPKSADISARVGAARAARAGG
jgi:hypothetical protein